MNIAPIPPEERPFLDAILAHPDDDEPRLVFADWLEERGDERAEWLRADVQWIRTGRTGPMRRVSVNGWMPQSCRDLTERFDWWQARMPPVGSRLEIINSRGLDSVRDLAAGVLFVHAKWSGISVAKMSQLASTLRDCDPEASLRLLVVDADEIESMEVIAELSDQPLLGAGETFWIRNGRVVDRDLYGHAPNLSDHATRLVDSLCSTAYPEHD